MKDRKAVLVTGAAGFIGSHLVRSLCALGHPVRAIDVRSPPRSPALSDAEYVLADIRDRERLGELVRDVDTVFHLASVHLEVQAEERTFEEVNVSAVDGLVSVCAEAGVRRIVHTSSVGIYGHVENPPADEDAPKRPQTPYERTKLAGEQAAVARARAAGMDLVVLRPAWVYGPGCPRTAKLIQALVKRRFFYVGDGANLRHPLYIDEMLQAYRLAASGPGQLAGHAYIIAGPEALTLREMVETFARVLGVPRPSVSIPRGVGWGLGVGLELAFGLARRDPPFSRRSLAFFENDNAFDIRAAQRDLSFQPSIDLEEGLRRILAAKAAHI